MSSKLPISGLVRYGAEKLGSLGFTCILLLFLLVLTFLGTLEQTELGLHAVQEKYFESAILTQDLFGVASIPLPGAGLLLALLFVNLVIGGIIRLRKTWSRAGILITHLGIALLLVAGWVKLQHSLEGHLTLYPEESSSEFVSYHEWEVAIRANPLPAGGTEYVIPDARIREGERATFVSDELPFDLVLADFAENSWPRRVSGDTEGSLPVVEGFRLAPMASFKEAEQNIAGVYAYVRDKETSEIRRGLLWGRQRHPWVFRAGGKEWAVDLRKRRMQLPFEIRLDEFTHEMHPRSGIARAFRSNVTKTEGGIDQHVSISMNEPLRRGGFTLYQSSYGPKNAPPGTPLFSTFAVVSNPSDQWPLYACLIMSLGLLMHFGRKLFRYLHAEARGRT